MAQTKIEQESYILFHLAGTSYGINSQSVKQLEIVEGVTPVPNTPGYVDGVVFTRGQVIPVINLRKRFGFEAAEYNIKTRMIVVTGEGRTVGVIVDSAREFIKIPAASIQPPPENIVGLSGKYLNGITNLEGRIVLILNIEALLMIENN